jgi:hypothetical protein
MGLVSRALPVQTVGRNFTGDKGKPSEFGDQIVMTRSGYAKD